MKNVETVAGVYTGNFMNKKRNNKIKVRILYLNQK